MQIIQSTLQDLPHIFEFYDAAIEYQKKVSDKHWQGFDRQLVAKEVNEQRQWKIMVDGEMACVFVVAFEDPFIWGERDRDDAIYLHRIVTHPDFRGRNFVKVIIQWALDFIRSLNRRYIRMDTWGDNEKLIAYYQQCGFRFLGIITPDFRNLPAHYNGISLSLFEIDQPLITHIK